MCPCGDNANDDVYRIRGGTPDKQYINSFIVELHKITNMEARDMAHWVKLFAAKLGNLSLIPERQEEHCGRTELTSSSCPLTSTLTVKHTGSQAHIHK